jgi:hypothetical protein
VFRSPSLVHTHASVHSRTPTHPIPGTPTHNDTHHEQANTITRHVGCPYVAAAISGVPPTAFPQSARLSHISPSNNVSSDFLRALSSPGTTKHIRLQVGVTKRVPRKYIKWPQTAPIVLSDLDQNPRKYVLGEIIFHNFYVQVKNFSTVCSVHTLAEYGR